MAALQRLMEFERWFTWFGMGALWTIGILIGILAMIVIGGAFLGIAWDFCTRERNGDVPVGASRLEVPVHPSMRRDSWYGRLYLAAYGADRGWIAALRMLWYSEDYDGISWDPPRRWQEAREPGDDGLLPVDEERGEYVAYCCDYHVRQQRARSIVTTFHCAPPYEQPFFADGRRVSRCPVFWKVMIAAWVYVPLVAFRRWAFGRIAAGARALWAPIGALLRSFWNVCGRGVRVAVVTAVATCGVLGLMYGVLTWQRTRMQEQIEQMHADAIRAQIDAQWKREGLRQVERERELALFAQRESTRLAQLRAPYVTKFTAMCAQRLRADPPHVGSCDPDVGMSREQAAQECKRKYTPHAAYFDDLATEHAEPCWVVPEEPIDPHYMYAEGYPNEERKPTRRELRRYEQESAAYTAYHQAIAGKHAALHQEIAAQLRTVFAAELQQELKKWTQAQTDARAEDARVLAVAIAEFKSYRGDPRALWALLEQRCDEGSPWNSTTRNQWYLQQNGRTPSGWSNHTCSGVAAAFMDVVRSGRAAHDAEAASRERAAWWRDTVLSLGEGLLWVLGFIVAIVAFGFSIAGIERAAPSVGRSAAWVGRGIWRVTGVPVLFVGYWLCYIPLSLIGVALLLVWRLPRVYAMRRAVHVVTHDTWSFFGSFARAKWERMCPIVEWK
ncbi:hypothetical protein HYV74_01775 [Candidatus Uhrbacteria bacterium]|nr:hypothetical protein [Candidatus Uhrbacteria bacterium]